MILLDCMYFGITLYERKICIFSDYTDKQLTKKNYNNIK